MIKIYEYVEKNLETAKEKAFEELNLKEEDLFLKESDEAGGLFKSKKVKLEVVKKDDIVEYLKELLNSITEKMGLEVRIEAKKREEYIKLNLFSNNNAILIGKNGKTIDALQIILRSSVQNMLGIKVNIIVDVEDYKEKQHQNLEYTVKKLAREVQRTGVEVRLDPMNSYERRIVHNACNSFEGIITESIGEEPERYIVIMKKD